jgi:predicted anti-sigma-YlaC factor YlaD
MAQPAVRCVEFVDSVTDWMEGALVDDDQVLVEEHLAICPHCVEYVDQLRLSHDVLRALGDRAPRETPPAGARETLLAAFRAQRGG